MYLYIHSQIECDDIAGCFYGRRGAALSELTGYASSCYVIISYSKLNFYCTGAISHAFQTEDPLEINLIGSCHETINIFAIIQRQVLGMMLIVS